MRWNMFVLASSLVAASCTADEPEPCSPTVMLSADPTTIASGDSVALTVTVTDFELEPPAADEAPDGGVFRHDGEGEGAGCHGHYHVYLDDLMTNPLLQDHVETVSLPVTADPGTHELIVRLNDPEHKIIKPEVTDRVEITVQ
jgi:hypothetical protein